MADVYKIGVSLAMTSNAPAFFSALSRQVLGVHGQVNALQGGLTQLSRMKLAIGGGLALVGGVAALKALGDVLDKGANLQRMQNNMRLGGMKEVEVAEATAKAWEMTAKYRSLGVVRIGDMINEVRTVFGDTKSAMENIEPALKSAVVLQSTLKGKGGSEKIVGQVFDMFKTADLRNVTDSPEATEKFFQQMTKVVNVTGGKVTPHDFLQMQKYAKGAGQGWTDQFITGPVASMMQEQSPSTVGQSLMSMHQAVAGGKMTKPSFDAFNKLGLINKDAIVYTTKGNEKNVKAGGVAGTDLFKDNPYEWVQKVLLPAIRDDLAKKGKAGLSDDDFNKEASTYFSAMFGNRNAENAAMTMSKARPIERDMELGRTAMGTEGADLLLKKDYHTALTAFTTQWDNLLTALGAPAVGTATEMLNRVTSGVTKLAQLAGQQENFETVSNIFKGLAATAAGLTGAGATALLAAIGPAGWFVGGIIALGAAAVAFKPQLDALGVQMDAAAKAFGSFVGTMVTEIGTWPSRLAEAIAAMGTAIVDKIKEVFGSLFGLNKKVNFEGGEGGATFQKAGFTTGGSANDNFGGASGVASAVRGSGGGAGRVGGGTIVPRGGSAVGTGAGGSWYESIMRAEGTAGRDPYNVVLGNGRYGLPSKPLTDMTLEEAYKFGRTVRARHGSSSAIGAFQIVGQTMKTFMGEAGLGWQDKFSPENQRKLAAVIRKRQGIGAWEGFKHHPGERANARGGPEMAAPPPTAGPPPKRQEQPGITHVYLNDRVIARAVTARQVAEAKYPNHVGGMDTHGSWRPPGTTLTDAA